MRLYKTDKKVLSFQNNPAAFLKGITSNTLEAPRNAFLDIHGKIVATFDQLKIADDEIWICLEAAFVPTVLTHIDKYVKLARVKVEAPDLNVYFDLDGNYDLKVEERMIPQKKGQLIITPHQMSAPVSEEEFTSFRLQHAIALHGQDYQDDFILNVSVNEFVSFTKGCFLGQEPVSKVYNRSKPTWRLVVKKGENCSEEERSKLTSPAPGPDGGVSGFVFEKNEIVAG